MNKILFFVDIYPIGLVVNPFEKEFAKVIKFIKTACTRLLPNPTLPQMILFKEAKSLQNYLEKEKKAGKKIGFVPTMGALHDGHISLIEISKKQTDITVCSIFVNPTQFNDKKDFEKYPVTIGEDILQLEKAKCHILFLPNVSEIYPAGTEALKKYELGEIEKRLEGKHRPGHFQGVCQVVDRLLQIVNPDLLFIGQKDYQQCIVINKLVQITGLPVKVFIGETLREPSGLAMSSRNQRLNNDEKLNATAIYKMLLHIKDHYTNFSFDHLKNYATDYLLQHGFNKVDYITIADANTLEEILEYKAGDKLVALAAAYIGEVRLIDNMVLTD